jgi:hypothetical protein
MADSRDLPSEAAMLRQGASDAERLVAIVGLGLRAYATYKEMAEAALDSACDALKGEAADAELAEYLKDGETLAECLARNRGDIDGLLTLLRQEKEKVEAQAREIAALRITDKPASENARRIVDDCTNRQGEISREALIRAISGVFVALFREQGRLPRYRDIHTGEIDPPLSAKDARLAVLEEALRELLRMAQAIWNELPLDKQARLYPDRVTFDPAIRALAGQEPT